jgi:hypothetical protein
MKSDATQEEICPDYPPLDDKMRRTLIIKYAWAHHRNQILFMCIIMVLLFMGVCRWNELSIPIYPVNDTRSIPANPTSWAGWLINMQSFFSLGTLLVALSVWWGEISEDWRDDLPKRLSVFFFDGFRPAIVCRYVWLAGADEIRQWGQQVAKQAAGNTNLDFGPNLEAKSPSLIIGPKGNVWLHYSVCFELTNLNKYLEDHSKKCIYQNLAKGFNKPEDIDPDQVECLSSVKEWISKKRLDKGMQDKIQIAGK